MSGVAVPDRPGPSAGLSTYDGLSTIATGGVWELLFTAVLGVTISSGEFRHQTMTATYLATSDRNRVLASKTAAAAVAGLPFAAATALLAGPTMMLAVVAANTTVPGRCLRFR